MNWEVRVMRSGISSLKEKGWFNATLLRKNLTRFWPLWAVYGILLLLCLDMPILQMRTTLYEINKVIDSSSVEFLGYLRAELTENIQYIVRNAMIWSVWMGAVFGCLLVMALFSYLMNRRSVGMIHALPIKREGLFLTNWISGLIFVSCPSLVAFLIALLAGLGKGVGLLCLEELLLWLLVNISVTMFFFAFALCCAMFTGQLLALPVFYGILNVLVFGMYALLCVAARILMIGISLSGGFPAPVRWFTPFYQLGVLLSDWSWIAMPDGTIARSLVGGSLQGMAYAILVGTVLLLIAYMVYRERQMERTEDLVTVSWVRPIFRYGVGVCTGFTFGTLLYEEFFGGGAWVYIALVVLCAVVGGFVGQMFLKKTLRVLRSGWKGSLALGVCMLVLLCGIRLDVPGLQRYVPRVDQVAWVDLYGVWTAPSDGGSYLSVELRDPALIEQVVELHRGVVDRLEEIERARMEDREWASTEYDTERFHVTYHLEDGRTVSREYSGIPVRKTDLEDPNSWGSQLLEFMEDPAIQWRSYLPEITTAEALDAVGGNLWIQGESDDRLEYEEAQILWAAIREDINAGRYHRYLFRDEECDANTTGCEIKLDLYGTLNIGGQERVTSTGITIRVQYTATATIRAMERLGYGDAKGKAPGGAELVAGAKY